MPIAEQPAEQAPTVEPRTDPKFVNLMYACPTSYQGDQGFRDWLKAFYNLAYEGLDPDWPVVTSVTPNTVTAGAPDTAITVAGLAFQNGAVVTAGTTDLATTFTNANSLGATIPTALLALAGTLNIGVRNPDEHYSTTLPFTVS